MDVTEVPLRHNSGCACWAPTLDNFEPAGATFGCCVGRIGRDRKGNAHLRWV